MLRLFFVLLAMGLSQSAQSQSDGPLQVELRLDHAQLIRLPAETATVVLGNPKIADVTPQRNGFYVLTGKSFGSTNLIVQGGNGDVLAAFLLRVLPNVDESQMTVQRGLTQEMLVCLPRCVPADTVAQPPTK